MGPAHSPAVWNIVLAGQRKGTFQNGVFCRDNKNCVDMGQHGIEGKFHAWSHQFKRVFERKGVTGVKAFVKEAHHRYPSLGDVQISVEHNVKWKRFAKR